MVGGGSPAGGPLGGDAGQAMRSPAPPAVCSGQRGHGGVLYEESMTADQVCYLLEWPRVTHVLTRPERTHFFRPVAGRAEHGHVWHP